MEEEEAGRRRNDKSVDKTCKLEGTQTRVRIEKTFRKRWNSADKAQGTRQDGRKAKIEGWKQATTEDEGCRQGGSSPRRKVLGR